MYKFLFEINNFSNYYDFCYMKTSKLINQKKKEKIKIKIYIVG